MGWHHDRTVGSHKIMKKDWWADYPFSFHDSEELGPAILSKISKKTGLQPKNLPSRPNSAPPRSDARTRIGALPQPVSPWGVRSSHENHSSHAG
ncbi:MAG: type II toxin-antitoxin system HicA family toxin [Bryobacteraceae bacterium]